MFFDHFQKYSTLSQVINEFSGTELKELESLESGLLSQVIVGCNHGKMPCRSSSFYSQSEIVDQVISYCFKNKINNIMTLGYSAASQRNPNNQLGSLINNFPNTIINELKSRPWEILLNQ